MDNSPSDFIGERGTIDKSQFMRLILQSLYSLGYSRSASNLELESGISLDSPEYSSLASQTLAGQWDSCIATIDSIADLDLESTSVAKFLVWRQHFLELLGCSDGLISARNVLGERISSLDLDRERVHRLAKSLIDLEGVVKVEDLTMKRSSLMLELLDLMPDRVRIPSGRLERLVEMALRRQLDSCLYHNSPKEISLCEDHECSSEQLPCKCSQILHEHKNEVWFVQFSNCGNYLASSSKDCTAIIWVVNEGDTLSLKHSLLGHKKPISFVAWSPDDKMLLTCGNEEVLKLWDIESGICKLTFASPLNCTISSCAWFPDSKKIVYGSYDPHNRICMCDLKGEEIEVWEGVRMPKVSDLAVTLDGAHLIICSSTEIWIQDFLRKKEWTITEENTITSLSVSRDGQYLIVNLNSQEIHLWNILGSSAVPHKFTGHKQEKYVIRSCFGGSDCLFIASGSEDSQVYIWHRQHEKPIRVLSGHLKTVSCVSWNPMKPHMLASASDDHTVRIWMANVKP